MRKHQHIESVCQNVKQTYFGLLRVGAAFGYKPLPSPRFVSDTQNKRFVFGHKSEWHGINEWSENKLGDYYSGSIFIYHGDETIWQMQYQGYYSQQGKNIVNRALREVSTKKMWRGGRGVSMMKYRGYRYENTFESDEQHPIASFFGKELITKFNNGDPLVVGQGWYRGGLMLDI